MHSFINFLFLLALIDTLNNFGFFPATATLQQPQQPKAFTDVIFIKAVPLPETFIRVAWYLVSSYLMKTSTLARVAMAFFLGSAVITALALQFFIFPKIRKESKAKDEELNEVNEIEFNEYSEANESSVPSETCEPKAIKLSSEIVLPTTYARAVGGCYRMELKTSSTANDVFGYANVSLESLFEKRIEPCEPALQERKSNLDSSKPRMSYADAVGYEKMEIKLPRNPNVFGYADLSLDDLFKEVPERMESFEVPTSKITVNSTYSFAGLKASKAIADIEDDQGQLDGITSDSTGGFRHVQAKLRSKSQSCDYSDSSLDNVYQNIPIESEADAAPPDPVIKMSYADAVGYEFMEVKLPRNPHVFGYADFSVAMLFEEREQPKQLPPKLTSNQQFILDLLRLLNQFPIIGKSSKKPRLLPKNILLNIHYNRITQ